MKPHAEDETTQNWLKEAQKGYIRMGVLILLNKKPAHGYELMKEINSRTKGFWQPTPGGVYPILNDLEASGYIKGQWQTQRNRRQKVYTITPSGNAILKRAIIKQTEIFNTVNGLFMEFAKEVLNIESPTPPPPMHTPLTPFLEDKKDSAVTLQQLEAERKHSVEHIKAIKERLKQLDERIVQLKRQAPSSSGEQGTA
ncbi:MAG: PadR family transcriptional regulator [Candidatus Bathyarchaeota archaeon]|nr:PadR family transcriptional regulator [Candidatus Bathyarchaeota archaeon]